MSEKGRKISKDLETIYMVVNESLEYRRRWRKAALRHHCRAVYGITLKDFLHVHKGVYHGYHLSQLKKQKGLF